MSRLVPPGIDEAIASSVLLFLSRAVSTCQSAEDLDRLATTAELVPVLVRTLALSLSDSSAFNKSTSATVLRLLVSMARRSAAITELLLLHNKPVEKNTPADRSASSSSLDVPSSSSSADTGLTPPPLKHTRSGSSSNLDGAMLVELLQHAFECATGDQVRILCS